MYEDYSKDDSQHNKHSCWEVHHPRPKTVLVNILSGWTPLHQLHGWDINDKRGYMLKRLFTFISPELILLHDKKYDQQSEESTLPYLYMYNSRQHVRISFEVLRSKLCFQSNVARDRKVN